MSEYDQLMRRLPHQPPMRMIDEILEASAEGAQCLARASQERCELFGDGSNLDTYAGVEMLAQTAAVALSVNGEGDKPGQGMLIQVAKFEAERPRVPRGSTLRCVCSVELGMEGQLGLAKGQVTLEGELVCEAKLTLAIGKK